MAVPKEKMSAGTDQGMPNLGRDMFKYAMRGEWRKVVATYKSNEEAYGAEITKTGETALHLVVRDGQEDILLELLDVMSCKPDKAKEALNVPNNYRNTALHIAAIVGNARMCQSIAKIDPSLVGKKNDDMETPFFLAARYGKRDAFLCLHNICVTNGDQGYRYYRKTDGETILHVAIRGEYFDLAFLIIRLYGELADRRNQYGITPLHLLATKPGAFRSGSPLGGYKKLIYHCIFVDELNEEEISDQPVPYTVPSGTNKPAYPENYETCMRLFQFPWQVLKFLLNIHGNSKGSQLGDAENQKRKELKTRRRRSIPANYYTFFDIFKFASKALLVILGLGSKDIKKLEEKKQKHTWSVQIMDELIQRVVMYEYDEYTEGKRPVQEYDHEYTGGKRPISAGGMFSNDESRPYMFGDSGEIKHNIEALDKDHQLQSTENKISKENENEKGESVILLAAKNGITEMVEKILEKYPVAIHDVNLDKKNIVLLAVENRQPHVYQLLLKRTVLRDSIFRAVDKDGNSALHLAAKLGDSKPWLIPGAALQMQWEFKWYKFVKNSMSPHFFIHHNEENKSPKELFTTTHQKLVESGGVWLTNTSNSCSLVAALIATVAFATSSTVPGGVNEDSGSPTLERHPAFNAFAISSLVALCFSVTSVVMFLSILTSRYQEKDFEKDLPRKLLVGLSALFVSIAAILVSFCSGHFFVLKDELEVAALPVYAVTCLPVTLFAIAQFPLYFDLVWATIKKVPQRSYILAN